MIRWCAYCQKYMGEAAPFDEFHLTHGICDRCREANRLEDLDEVRVRGVAGYFRKVEACLTIDQLSIELLDEGLELGLQPWDLLIGIIQPALRNMGERWTRAEATNDEEAGLTASCSRILDLLRARQPGFEALGRAPHPEVLLVNAEGNAHRLGLALVEFFLLTQGVAARVLPEAQSTADVLKAIQEFAPRKVGISCALPGQVHAAARMVAAITVMPARVRPQVYLGGNGVRGYQAAVQGWPCRICTDPSDLLDPPPARL